MGKKWPASGEKYPAKYGTIINTNRRRNVAICYFYQLQYNMKT